MPNPRLDNLNQSVLESNRSFENTYKKQSESMSETIKSYQRTVSDLDQRIRAESDKRFKMLEETTEQFDKYLVQVFSEQREKLDKASENYAKKYAELKYRAESVQKRLDEEQQQRDKAIEEFYKQTQDKIDSLYDRLTQIAKRERESSQKIREAVKIAIDKQMQLLIANKQEASDKLADLNTDIDYVFEDRMSELTELKKNIAVLYKETSDSIAKESEERKRQGIKYSQAAAQLFGLINRSEEGISRLRD